MAEVGRGGKGGNIQGRMGDNTRYEGGGARCHKGDSSNGNGSRQEETHNTGPASTQERERSRGEVPCGRLRHRGERRQKRRVECRGDRGVGNG